MSRSPHRAAWYGAAVLCVFSCFGSVGCVVADMAEEAWFQTRQALRPSADGYSDPTENPADDWSEVRKFGRPDQKLIRDDESWYNKTFKSPKARDIERNLGFDAD